MGSYKDIPAHLKKFSFGQVLDLALRNPDFDRSEMDQMLGRNTYSDIRYLVKHGYLSRHGLGVRGHPYQYQRRKVEDVSVELLPPRPESEPAIPERVSTYVSKPEMRKLLKELGWTQVKFASQIGLDPSTVSDWREERIPGPAAAYLRLAVHMSRWEKA